MTTKELSANELADRLIQLNYDLSLVADSHPKLKGLHKEDSYIKDAATMLRTIPALEAEKVDLIMQIDIQKVVGRDLHMNVLNEIIKNQDSEIESLKGIHLAEIIALLEKIESLCKADLTQKSLCKAEPVAWMQFWGNPNENLEPTIELYKVGIKNEIPLYDHPAKTLTQAQIMEVIRQTSFADGYLNDNLIRFAEAILKEAGEK